MTMKMIPLLAWAAALPVFAQSPTPPPPAPCAPCAPCCCKGCCKEAPPCKADFSKKMLERFDADKDGKLDAQELSAMNAACGHNHGKRPGKHGGKDMKGMPCGKDACPDKGACPGKQDAPAAPTAPATPTAPAA